MQNIFRDGQEGAKRNTPNEYADQNKRIGQESDFFRAYSTGCENADPEN